MKYFNLVAIASLLRATAFIAQPAQAGSPLAKMQQLARVSAS